MNDAESTAGKPEAASDETLTHAWELIDWDFAQAEVNRLQARIAKARLNGQINKERRLAYLLTHSFYAKALAVKQVTTAKGRHTPGIDKVIWNTPAKKMRAIGALTDKRYKAQPLRRVNIPKKGKQATRPLGIPTMYDRAMQALYLLALDPIVETVSDTNSYGFRKGRCAADAAQHIHFTLSGEGGAPWVLEGDIKGCFDNISHDWLVENIPMDKSVLKQFLKAGYVFEDELFPTVSGTPQGGVISATLANATLNGVQKVLEEKYHTTPKTGIINWRYRRKNKVILIRYADDFIVSAATREIAEEVKGIIADFLGDRGLELSNEKTSIVHIDDGFDFLGWNFRKYNGKLIVKPSKKSVANILNECRRITKTWGRHMTQGDLILMLNRVIRGWAYYHRVMNASKVFGRIDYEVFGMLWRWAKRKHPRKGKRWIAKRYWTPIGTRKWTFTDGSIKLAYAGDVKIRYHVLVRLGANAYLDKEYFKNRVKLRRPSSQAVKSSLEDQA